MTQYTKQIGQLVGTIVAGTIIEASGLHRSLLSNIPEATYYKTFERLVAAGTLVRVAKGLYYRPKESKFGKVPISEQQIVEYYTKNNTGVVVGYRMYNNKGITTQVGKKVEVLSTALEGQKKTIENVKVERIEVPLTEETIPVIETLEILQNLNKIEDLNVKALVQYIKSFSANYSDEATNIVLNNRKYKKSTIALLRDFLEMDHVEHSLDQHLSSLSKYEIPNVEEMYEAARV